MENSNIINNFNLTELLTKYNDNPYILSRLATFLQLLTSCVQNVKIKNTKSVCKE